MCEVLFFHLAFPDMSRWLMNLINRARKWLSEDLLPLNAAPQSRPNHAKQLIYAGCCAMVFAVALGVRTLHWNDAHVEIERGDTLLTELVRHYRYEAGRMVQQGRILFPTSQDRSDARLLVHPPGYAVLIAALDRERPSRDSYPRLRLVQVICDALAAVVVFAIAAQLLPLAVGMIAGLLVAISPHLSHYSLWLSPDSLSVLPILIALYLVTRALRHPRLLSFVAAGVLVGLSCWLRSNALLLPVVLAAIIFLLFERGGRLKYSTAFAAAVLVVISPITIRNWIVFHSFIPLSLGAGITLIEGIADYDDQDRFGLPRDDTLAALKDAEWYGRDDYAKNLWVPDGVERDRARLARGLAVIRSNPGWFLTVMLKRAASMLRYNDSGTRGWAHYIASSPIVSAEPAFGGNPSSPPQENHVWGNDAAGLVAAARMVSSRASISPGQGSQPVRLEGDASIYGDQLAVPVPVKPHTDYVMILTMEVKQGRMAIKMTSSDRRFVLASANPNESDPGLRRRLEKSAESDGTEISNLKVNEVPFATNNRTEVLMVLGNNDNTSEGTIAEISRLDLYEIGPTPNGWTNGPRVVIRGLQKNIFVTRHLVPAIAIGILILGFATGGRVLLLLLAAPVYYLVFQSMLHTEYRYILAIHYFLFILAAVPLYCVGLLVYRSLSSLRLTHPRPVIFL